MNKKNQYKIHCLFFLLFLFLPVKSAFSQEMIPGSLDPNLEKKIVDLMDEGDIPGLALAVVREGQPVFSRGYGYADQEKQMPVTPETRFELASCSKAFTALAVLKLEAEGKIELDASVSKYLPWFSVFYEGKKVDITVRQFLHQTSGIPWKSIDRIEPGNQSSALEQAVRSLVGIELDNLPGKKFQYATINYDVLGLLIEKLSGLSYEDYMARTIFSPLGLAQTTIGREKEQSLLANGYKISFFSAQHYQAPVYRGNYPAGYIVSNIRDMARWLQWQMGLVDPGSEFYRLMQKSHEQDKTVPPGPVNFSAYAMGWFAYLDGSDLIDHGGVNPNFTSYIGFLAKHKIGVAVLANSNSNYTREIGDYILKYLVDPEKEIPYIGGDSFDKGSSVISFLLIMVMLSTLAFLLSIIFDLVKGRRQFAGFKPAAILRVLAILLVFVPILAGIYLIPYAMSGVSWKTALVWAPFSFQVTVILLLAAIGLGFIGFLMSILFPHKSRYLRSLPLLIVLSLLSGGANAVVIFLISSSLFSRIELFYQVYYFVMAFFIYILGRKVVQTRLVALTYDIVYDMRMKLVEKVFLTSYQRFEKLDRGRVFATLNDDTGQIGHSANIIVQLITSVITTIGAFFYLATIAFWATAVTLLVVAVIATFYSLVSQKSRHYLEEARDTRDVYMGLLNGMLDGFKELSLQVNKKREYGDDVAKSSDDFRKKTTFGLVKFINAFLIGESLLIVVLGAVGFAIPRLFPEISTFTLMSFIMILLYLIGPINGILNSIPVIMQIRVSFNRVKKFEKDVPANIDPKELTIHHPRPSPVESIEAENILFEYESQDEDEKFVVGPLNFQARKGEITFIIGGNGSGKTTLAKLLTGLYTPHQGRVAVDGRDIESNSLGEYFSTVFSDYHLFSRLYNVEMDNREGEVRQLLDMLRLTDKVSLKGNTFSTIGLSGGQRKRLALLQCYLEDSPIYLFDEIAADQDPEFRKFFYRTLLPRMKEEGKIVIAITHDDHYFDVADKIVKMDMGKIEIIERGTEIRVTV